VVPGVVVANRSGGHFQVPPPDGEAEVSRWLVTISTSDGAELIHDPEGSELATMEDARSQALKSARELWADAIKSGRSLGADAVVIADERVR
jgi:hypothetical protein